jgi:hypothetical protein
MLKPRLSVAPPLGFCLWVGAVALAGFWGCQGPDTFIRKEGSGGTTGAGGFRGAGGAIGVGGHVGIGGTIGTGTGGGVGGHIGTGGAVADASTDTGGLTGTGGARDGGVDGPGPDVMTGTGGRAIVDASSDVEGGVVAGTGPCAGICDPSTVVTTFTVTPGHDFHSSAATLGLGEGCFASTADSIVQGIVCSNFTASGGNRMISVNGVADPTCAFGAPGFTVPPKISGGYCFQISAGVPDFAGLTVF